MFLKKKIQDIIKFSVQNYLKFPKIPLNHNQKYLFSSKMADQGKRTKETTGESISDSSMKIGGVFEISKNPKYIEERIKLYDSIIANQKKILETSERRPIQITLKDGKVLEGISFQTTPLEIARKISKKLAENTVIAKITYTKKVPSPLDEGKNTFKKHL